MAISRAEYERELFVEGRHLGLTDVHRTMTETQVDDETLAIQSVVTYRIAEGDQRISDLMNEPQFVSGISEGVRMRQKMRQAV